MSLLYYTKVSLGRLRTGMVGVVGYRLVSMSEQVLLGFRTTGVVELAVPGEYAVPDGITVPDNLSTIIQWGDNSEWWSQEVVDPRLFHPLGSGLYTVEVTLQDEASVVVPGALVTIQDEDGAIVAWGQTDLSGAIHFALNPGTYQVLVNAGPGFESLPAQELDVMDNAEVVYTLTRQTPDPPASAQRCRVYGYLVKEDGTVAPGVKITFSLRSKGPVRTGSGILVAHHERVVDKVTDAEGYFEVDLLRSDILVGSPDVRWQVTCSVCKLSAGVTLDSATFDIANVIGS